MRRWVCVCYVNETPTNINMMSVHNRMLASVYQPAESPFNWIVMKVWWSNKSSLCFFNVFWSLLKSVNQHLNYTKHTWASGWVAYFTTGQEGRSSNFVIRWKSLLSNSRRFMTRKHCRSLFDFTFLFFFFQTFTSVSIFWRAATPLGLLPL